MDDDLYTILGLDRAATDEEIRKAYKRAIRKAHPDAGGKDEGEAAAINRARDILLDPKARSLYDAGFSDPDEVREEAGRLISSMFESIVDTAQPVASLRLNLRQMTDQGKRLSAQCEARIKRLRQPKKWRRRSEGDDILANVVAALLGKAEQEQADVKRKLVLLKVAGETLDEYEDLAVPPPPTSDARWLFIGR